MTKGFGFVKWLEILHSSNGSGAALGLRSILEDQHHMLGSDCHSVLGSQLGEYSVSAGRTVTVFCFLNYLLFLFYSKIIQEMPLHFLFSPTLPV